MPIAPPVPTMGKELLGDARLGACVLTEPSGELLRSHRDRATPYALGDALVDEHVEVAPYRHLADVELDGEVGHSHATVDVESLPHEVEPFEGLHVHRWVSSIDRSVARAASADAYAPSAMPCTSAFPSAAASIGPVDTGSSVWARSASRYRPARDSSAEHADAGARRVEGGRK